MPTQATPRTASSGLAARSSSSPSAASWDERSERGGVPLHVARLVQEHPEKPRPQHRLALSPWLQASTTAGRHRASHRVEDADRLGPQRRPPVRREVDDDRGRRAHRAGRCRRGRRGRAGPARGRLFGVQLTDPLLRLGPVWRDGGCQRVRRPPPDQSVGSAHRSLRSSRPAGRSRTATSRRACSTRPVATRTSRSVQASCRVRSGWLPSRRPPTTQPVTGWAWRSAWRGVARGPARRRGGRAPA